MLKKSGLIVGSGAKNVLFIENQLWGFNRNKRDFFERYYASALKCAYEGENGWRALSEQIQSELFDNKEITFEDICLGIDDDGSKAEHPGHAWCSGFGEQQYLALPASGNVTVFNKKSSTKQAGNNQPLQTIKSACSWVKQSLSR